MTKIEGHQYFPSNMMDKAIDLYRELDSYGYSVELSSCGKYSEARHKVSWLGYSQRLEDLPKNVSKTER